MGPPIRNLMTGIMNDSVNVVTVLLKAVAMTKATAACTIFSLKAKRL